MKLITYKEFQDLAVPLSASGYEHLEREILKRGCRQPIITWGDVIIDGHKRYAICTKHNLPFTVDNMEFRSFAEAKRWAHDHAIHIAECRAMLAELDEDDEPEKTVAKPMFELPPKPVTPFRMVWDIDTMSPADVEEFVQAIHKRFGRNCMKELAFKLFGFIASLQDADDTRQLLQQLYNLHYTPSFKERRHGISQF